MYYLPLYRKFATPAGSDNKEIRVNKSIKKIKWNHQKHPIQKRAGRRGTKQIVKIKHK